MALDSMGEILERINAEHSSFWQVVLATDLEERQVTEEQSMAKMRMTWQAMLESVEQYQGQQRSVSGLVGGDGARMRQYAAAGDCLCGPYLQEVISTALCVGEANACMRKIVAAPTAGACGVLPAVLVPLYQDGRPTRNTSSRRCMSPPVSARSSAIGPASRAPPAAVRQKSAARRPWRRER
jgi:L-serine dehydratase